MASSVTFVTSALTCMHYALLRRAMRFQAIGVIETSANLVSAASAVTIAFFGFHYWALVLRPIFMTTLTAVGVWVCCGWVPARPRLTMGVREMVKFGLHSTGFTMTDFFGRSADRVMIGFRAGARALGYYQNAMFIYDNLLDVMVFPLHGVAVASLSKVRSDPEELRRLWRKALSTLVFYSMPVFGILAVTSRDVISLLLGAKWASAGSLLSVLALRGIPHAVERTSGWLHVAAGRSDRWMRWGVLGTCSQLLALLCGVSYGPLGISTAYVICTFILFIPAIAYSGQPFNIGAGEVVRTVWRPLCGSLTAAAVGFILKYTVLAGAGPISRVAALLIIYLVTYAAVVVVAFGEQKPLWVVLNLVEDYLPAGLARRVRREALVEAPPEVPHIP
jgi:PST family polysaccharide transporter